MLALVLVVLGAKLLAPGGPGKLLTCPFCFLAIISISFKFYFPLHVGGYYFCVGGLFCYLRAMIPAPDHCLFCFCFRRDVVVDSSYTEGLIIKTLHI